MQPWFFSMGLRRKALGMQMLSQDVLWHVTTGHLRIAHSAVASQLGVWDSSGMYLTGTHDPPYMLPDQQAAIPGP
jgi:hypothetical protein